MNINKSTLATIDRPPTGYQLHWDSKLRGFGVRVTSSGVISFIVQTRINRKERRKTLGRVKVISVEKARKMALAWLSEAAEGIDPVERETERKVRKVVVSKVFEDYLKTRKNLKARTVKDMKQSLAEMFADWMDKPVVSISQDLVKKRHAYFGKKRSEARANLGMRYLRSLINFAISEYTDSNGQPIIESNPVSILSKQKAWFEVKRRKTYIKQQQLKPWFDAVQGLSNTNAKDFFIICILTGLRRSEALELQWQHIDLTEKTINLPDTKNGDEHNLPMSDYLYELFKSRYESKACKYVFESKRGRIMCVRDAVYKVREVSQVTFNPHDLRRTFITVGDSLDLSYYAIKKLLNHKDSSDVTAGYIVTDVDRLRKPMQQITDYFLSAWGLNEDNVVALPNE